MRKRLTELQIDFVAHQVPREQEDRNRMERLTGSREIPTLVTDDGETVTGEDAILAHLG